MVRALAEGIIAARVGEIQRMTKSLSGKHLLTSSQPLGLNLAAKSHTAEIDADGGTVVPRKRVNNRKLTVALFTS